MHFESVLSGLSRIDVGDGNVHKNVQLFRNYSVDFKVHFYLNRHKWREAQSLGYDAKHKFSEPYWPYEKNHVLLFYEQFQKQV